MVVVADLVVEAGQAAAAESGGIFIPVNIVREGVI